MVATCGGDNGDGRDVDSGGDDSGINEGGGSSDGAIGSDYAGDIGHFCIKFYNLQRTFACINSSNIASNIWLTTVLFLFTD